MSILLKVIHGIYAEKVCTQLVYDPTEVYDNYSWNHILVFNVLVVYLYTCMLYLPRKGVHIR